MPYRRRFTPTIPAAPLFPDRPKDSGWAKRVLGRAALCVLAAGAVFLTTRAPASAQATSGATHEIEIGEFMEGVRAESMAFYPSSLRVRSGDVLHFTNEFGSIPESGVHGALALPPGEEPLEWEQQNARNLDGDWAFFQTDPDDDPGDSPSALKGNWDEYESSGMRGPIAGIPRKPYTLRFPQSSGRTVWDYACQLHPTMRGAIRVL